LDTEESAGELNWQDSEVGKRNAKWSHKLV